MCFFKLKPAAVAVAVGLAAIILSSAAAAHIEQDMPPSMAVMEYRILLEFKPQDHRTRLKFAAALLALERVAEAEKEANRVLSAEPDNFDATDLLGLIRLRQGKIGASVKLFEKAISLKPDDVLVFYHLGQARVAMGQKEKGLAAFRKALENNVSSGKNQEKWRKMINTEINDLIPAPKHPEKKP